MADIKTREVIKGTIKNIDKSVIATQKTKDNLVNIKEKSENSTSAKEQNANEYAINKIGNSSRVIYDNSGKIKNKGNQAVKETKENIKKAKTKVKTIKTKLTEKRKFKSSGKGIKTSKNVTSKGANRVVKESMKASQRAMKMAKTGVKKTAQGIKAVTKATISSIKAIIAGTKALITALIAGGWVALIVIIIICLVGLLCSSIFGIFFSGEKSSSNAITMQDAIAECNQDFSNKLQSIQDSNPHDEYVLDGNMATWKDVLLVYTIKQSNGNNENEVVTMDNMKKQILKQIFWDMNVITFEVKNENITYQGVNSLEMPKQEQKRVLHITITSKTAEQMKTEYNFSPLQLSQYSELNSDEYSSLWNNVIYGMDSGEYISWRQKGATWSNIRIGNTTATISDIGCLVTSVAILIQKSGVDVPNINPFNPGTFVEALNQNGGFDENGNLQYGAINKIIPNFKYGGNVDLRGKTKEEKLSLISNYLNQGYYITAEVKGATEGNQHWVAVIDVDGYNVMMVDPGSDHTNLWNAYEYSKTSQFNYFIKIE